MKDLILAAISAAKDRWHTHTGLFLVLGTAVGLLLITFAGVDLRQISLSEWIITVTILVCITFVWLKTRLPRVPKGRVGFGVAIQFEESEHERQLRSDFLVTLRELLMASQLKHQFSFIELPRVLRTRSSMTTPLALWQYVRISDSCYSVAHVSERCLQALHT